MERDLLKRKKSLKRHNNWQFNYFNTIKKKLLEKVEWWKDKGENDKASNLMKEVKKMRFQFDKSTASINFGKCSKFQKDVSFIPNVCQLETQGCFEHRRADANVL